MSTAPNCTEIAERLLPCDGTFRCVHHLHFIRCPAYSRDDVIAELRQTWNAAVIECLEIQLSDDVDWRDSIDAMRALRVPEEP